ncbi:MAG TPA: hypothetical protein VHJ39_19460 [Solirubrobacteraceae bacterium]|nr:hypothetical protein [Solirubrobacteraceae bacterium]
MPPSGWRVNDIQCVGPDPTQFVIDVANGLVTVTHGVSSEQTRSFTNGKVNASGPPSSGIAPSPPSDELPLRIKVAERRGTTKILRYRVLVPV